MWSVRWRKSWPDWGRIALAAEQFLSTNNIEEREMRELTKMTGDYILKRLTELIERLSGFGLRGRSPVPSMMQKAAIEARDQDAGACSRSPRQSKASASVD